MSSSTRISRRGLLGVGAAAMLSPLLRSSRSFAQAAPPPKRIVIVFSADGTVHPNWVPTGSETGFTLSPILQPLMPYRSKLLVLDNVNNEAARHGDGDDHMRGMGTMLTGIELLPGTTMGGGGTPAGFAGGISVDQTIANQVGMATTFPSLEFGVQVINADVWSRMCYRGSNQPMPPMENPYAAYARMFASSSLSAAQLAILRARRHSVLDYVQANLTSVSAQIPAGDRPRLQAHLESVRAVERQLDAASAACTPPMQGAMIPLSSGANYPAIGRLQMDLLATALGCDLTRVATLQWSHSVSNVAMSWLGISDGHHTLSHTADTDTASQDKLVQIATWYAQQFAYLLQKLDSIPEGSGTLLDNTAVVWVNELAKGNIHSHAPLPVVIAGGCGGYFRTGRFVQYATPQLYNNVLVSLANAMGVPITSFGNPMYCTGAAPNLH